MPDDPGGLASAASIVPSMLPPSFRARSAMSSALTGSVLKTADEQLALEDHFLGQVARQAQEQFLLTQ